MGFFTKLAENMSTGSDATLSMRGILTSFDENTGKGTIRWAGKTYQINANPNGKYGIYEVFPYAVPPIGASVLFNVDSTQRYAIQVMAANKNQRGMMNYLEELKRMKG